MNLFLINNLIFKKYLKKILIFFFSLIIIFLIFEFLIRIFFAFNLGYKSLFYGFDKNIRISITSIKTFDFELKELKKIKKLNKNNNNFNKNIFVFGGSTSFGENCSVSNPRSWVNYLSQEMRNFNVINFAQNGLMSNNSLEIFNNYLRKKNTNKYMPDLIIWAHRYNDGFITLYNKKQILFLMELNKTLESKSLFYFVYSSVIGRLSTRKTFGFRKELNRKLNKRDLELIVNNYSYHTKLAIRLSKEINSKFMILRLPSKYNIAEKKFFQFEFSNYIKSEMVKIGEENKVPFYDMEKDAHKYFLQDKQYYCDNVHPNDNGAQIISNLITTYLKNEFNFND